MPIAARLAAPVYAPALAPFAPQFAARIVQPSAQVDGQRIADMTQSQRYGGGATARGPASATPRVLGQGDKAVYWAGGGVVIGALAAYFLSGRSPLAAGIGGAVGGAGAYLLAV